MTIDENNSAFEFGLMSIDTLYLVHHSHTDIGSTGNQPTIWELQTRFITQALEQVEREAERFGVERATRWIIETAGELEYWLPVTNQTLYCFKSIILTSP